MSATLNEALRLADLGYRVFPCHQKSKVPIPSNGCNGATTDEEKITAWFSTHPKSNLAMSTDGLIVIDIDDPKKSWPEDPDQCLSLGAAPQQRTPNGKHYVFRCPEGFDARNSVGRLAESVDVRARGGYIVVAPSSTKDGIYEWTETMRLEVGPEELPEPPEWLMERLRAKIADRPTITAGEGNTIGEGVRNATLASIGGTLRNRGCAQNEILATLSEINKRCSPPLPENEVRKIAESVSRYEPDQFLVAATEHHFDEDRGKNHAPTIDFLNASTWVEEPEETPDPILDGVFDIGDKCFLVGGSKTRKSFVTLQLALSLAAGVDVLGMRVPHARYVMLCQYEIQKRHYHKRLQRMARAMKLRPKDLGERLMIANLRGRKTTVCDIREAIQQAGVRPDLIIVDPLYKLYRTGHDENSAGDAAEMLFEFDLLAQSAGSATLVVHHDNKYAGSETKSTARGAGSGVLARDYDAAITITPETDDDPGLLRLRYVLRNHPPREDALIRWVGDRYEPETDATEGTAAAIMAWIESEPAGRNPKDVIAWIRERAGCSEKKARAIMDAITGWKTQKIDGKWLFARQ